MPSFCMLDNKHPIENAGNKKLPFIDISKP